QAAPTTDVIANEHLTEALRRLRKNASDENVDRRLVTNVILSYLTTARGDSKRFEMLSLLASILSWSDTERETAGLQKQSAAAKQQAQLGRKSSSAATGGRPSPLDVPKQEESESFSKLWNEVTGHVPATFIIFWQREFASVIRPSDSLGPLDAIKF
ncbi:hypothetical protein FS837_007685, partial [Tulasnella sp. UAMH 9824]